MINYLTVAEVVMLYGRPAGTVRRLASVYQWRRANDRRRPALYNAIDVEATMECATQHKQLDTVTCGEQ